MTKEWNDYLDEHGYDIVLKVLGGNMRNPDMSIQPDGEDYIFRWHQIPRNEVGANIYLHLQVASDPERPLHDHPWDNCSHILAGGYRELYVPRPEQIWDVKERRLDAGSMAFRRAEEAHRIFQLPEFPYTISLFTTGPVIREWGFWFVGEAQGTLRPRRWRHHDEVIIDERFVGEQP